MTTLMKKLFGDVATQEGAEVTPILPVDQTDLEQMLLDLAAFGKPRLSLQDGGWHGWISMHVKAIGTSVDVRSEFDHKTPREALICCAKRVQEMLRINKENQ